MAKPNTATWRMTDQLAAQLLSLESFARRKRYRPTQRIYEQGETSAYFYFVISGLVQVSIVRPDGTELVLENMGPNTICGEGAAFDGLPRFSSATAIEETEALEFDAARFGLIIKADPGIALALLHLTSLKQRILAVRLEHLASNSPEERILELLRRLEQVFAVDHPKGRKILTHLTHEQIASMTGTSRVTVTRTLARLRKSGQIMVQGGAFILKS